MINIGIKHQATRGSRTRGIGEPNSVSIDCGAIFYYRALKLRLKKKVAQFSEFSHNRPAITNVLRHCHDPPEQRHIQHLRRQIFNIYTFRVQLAIYRPLVGRQKPSVVNSVMLCISLRLKSYIRHGNSKERKGIIR